MKELIQYVKENGQEPIQYVLNKFEKYNIILLAESHAIKNNLKFIHELIPKLYKNGIYNLGMEFGASEDQTRLDELVTAKAFDEDLARELLFNYNTIFPYKEYWEVYKVVWRLNKTLPENARKFRVLNLSYKYNWKDYQGIRTPETVSKVFHKGTIDKYRANIIKKEIIDDKEKIAILTGSIHAFTKYHYPLFDYLANDFVRFENRHLGNLLYQEVPHEVFCIILHFMFTSKDETSNQLPAYGQIDKILNELNQPFACDLLETPVGKLSDDSYFSTGYSDFKLADLADGYIVLNSLENMEGCTIDYQFLKQHPLEDVQNNFPDPEWHRVPQNMNDYWKLIEDYVDMKRRHYIKKQTKCEENYDL